MRRERSGFERSVRGQRRRWLCTGLLAALVAAPAAAQDVRPGDERPELPPFEPAPAERAPLLELPQVPDFEPPPREPGTTLPPVPRPEQPDTEGVEAGVRVSLRAVHVVGNTVLSDPELATLTAPYLGRPLGFEDLQALRDDLTRAYVARGYETSGALIPSQELANGVLELWVYEGRVSAIEVQTDGRLRPDYVRERVAHGVGPPVNVRDLEQTLQTVQRDPNIERIDASLVPGEVRGESILRVRVTEARPWRLRLAGNNYSTPAIGGGRGELEAGWGNVTGFGDALWTEYKAGVGLQDVRAAWRVPLTAWDTALDLHFRRTWSEVVEAPFARFDIRSRTQTYGFTLSQPVYRTPRADVEAFLTGEWRRSQTFLFGEPWSFVPGPHDGEATLSVLRFGIDAAWRERDQALAARSLLSVGLPILGATENSGKGVPDAEFVAWLLQLQWARRFPELHGIQLVARGDVQLADAPLFGLEQFALGGHDTVRGYPENRLVRDDGLVGSVELRIPLPTPSWREWQPRLEVVPFVDAGYSWNTDRGESGPQTLVSVGVGGRLALTDRLLFQVFWGEALESVATPIDSLQADGVQLGISWEAP